MPEGEIRVEPEDREVQLDGSGDSVSIDYRAFYVPEDGSEQEVTDQATFWVANPALGEFSGNTFESTPGRAGLTNIFAQVRGLQGHTRLTMTIERTIVEDGVDSSAPDRFEGATEEPSQAPEIVYPADNVMLPPNLNELEFHLRPHGNDVFELTFEGANAVLNVYFECQPVDGGCVYTPSEDVWETLSQAERGTGPVPYTLRGVDDESPDTVGVAAERQIRFGKDHINGGVYYWNAGAGSIRRYDFGLRGQSAESFLDRSNTAANQCVGCHAVSRDGSKIAAGLDIPGPATLQVLDVATRESKFVSGGSSPFGSSGGGNFFSFSPDASKIAVSGQGSGLKVLNANSGEHITTPANNGSMPSWSPSGDRIAYADGDSQCFGGVCQPGVKSASIKTIEFDGSMWRQGSTLVPQNGGNNFYPAFSPDGEWVLYNRSPSNMLSMPDNHEDEPTVTDFQIWAVPAQGGSPIRLDRATGEGDSWPKWDPTEYEYQGHPLYWFTFSSRRSYGLRLDEGEHSQIWMAAFDPTKAQAGEDPSTPAFWLPFQEMDSGNHIAQWVTKVERMPCNVDEQCGQGEFCSEGVCVPNDIDPF
jgi:hypothetical protein